MGKLCLVGNYVEIPDQEEINNGGDGSTITFIGKMDYEPNILAVQYFSKEIFPQIRQRYPEVKFLIIGAKPEKRVLELSSIAGVEVTGYVDSVIPYIQATSVVVAPMQSGSGIQNKIIQAMAYGCCTVTTPVGAEGLNVDESGLTVCSDTNSWIHTLLTLLDNKSIRIEKGQISRMYVEKNMSKDIIRKQFRNFIDFK